MCNQKILKYLLWLAFIILMIILWASMAGCSVISKPATWETHGKPNSLAKNVPRMVTRSQFATDKDFYISVKEQLDWLWTHGYEVTSFHYVYGYDMTQREVLKYALIYFKELKNDKEEN